jgi:transcriptional regulator with XRE-family HTH domain
MNAKLSPVPTAPAEHKIGPARVSSGDRGASVADLLDRVEKRDPGFEEAVGLSSAAIRAGEMVREMRRARGWTQVQLADKLGWNQVRISNIERGQGTRGPTFDVLSKIAAACDYRLDYQPRVRAASVVKNKPASKSVQEILQKIWNDIAADLPRPVSLPVYAFEPDFEASCYRFLHSIQEGTPDHLHVHGAESDITRTIVGLETQEPPFLVLSGHGQRMTLLPVAVEKVETAAGDFAVQVVRPKL